MRLLSVYPPPTLTSTRKTSRGCADFRRLSVYQLHAADVMTEAGRGKPPAPNCTQADTRTELGRGKTSAPSCAHADVRTEVGRGKAPAPGEAGPGKVAADTWPANPMPVARLDLDLTHPTRVFRRDSGLSNNAHHPSPLNVQCMLNKWLQCLHATMPLLPLMIETRHSCQPPCQTHSHTNTHTHSRHSKPHTEIDTCARKATSMLGLHKHGHRGYRGVQHIPQRTRPLAHKNGDRGYRGVQIRAGNVCGAAGASARPCGAAGLGSLCWSKWWLT